MRSYEIARKLFSFLEFIGWLSVVGGIIGGLVLVESAGQYASDAQKFALFTSGAIFSLIGLLFVGAVQAWRASVDSAEYGQQMLMIVREQLEVSRQSLRPGKSDIPSFRTKADEQDAIATGSPSFEDLAPAKDEPDQPEPEKIEAPTASSSPNVALGLEDGVLEYKGETIKVEGGKFFVDGVAYKSLKYAHKCVERNQMRS